MKSQASLLQSCMRRRRLAIYLCCVVFIFAIFEVIQIDTDYTNDESLKLLLEVCDADEISNGSLLLKQKLVLQWLCKSLANRTSDTSLIASKSCPAAIVYQPIGRLGNIMGLYAIIYSYTLKYKVSAYVEEGMWITLKNAFPQISLNKSNSIDVEWQEITYQEVDSVLPCKTEEDYSKQRYYWITNYPDRNGLDVFHPFYAEIKKQFEFSESLKLQAQELLLKARGNRTSVTYIGFHIRRTDYLDYIRRNYNMSVPERTYYDKCLEYYRERFTDALFIVCSDDMKYVRSEFASSIINSDMVLAGDGDIDSPARDMAVIAACNHSIVTVGTYGFWGAYLAGGTVLTPDRQTHQSRGDRATPLLEIQLAGANNWIAV